MVMAFSLISSAVAHAGQVNLITDGSFENPTTNSWQYQPASTGWTFSVLAGISNGVNPGYGGFCTTGAVPDGKQFGFIQRSGDYFSQAVNFPATGSYTLSYFAGGRLGSDAPWPYGPYGGDTSYSVLLNSRSLVSNTTITNVPMAQNLVTFNATAGIQTLEFLITSVSTTTIPTTDQSALFDNVSITAVPEPASSSLLVVAGMITCCRKNRRTF